MNNINSQLLKYFEISEDGFFFLDENFSLHTPTQRASELLKIDESENISLEEHLKKFELMSPKLNFKEKTLPFLIELKRPDSNIFPPLFLKIIIIENFIKNTPHPFIGIIQDVTKNHIEYENQYDFLSLISHKLRTPMVALAYSMNLVKQREKLNFSEKETDDFIEQAHFKTLEISEIFEKIIHYCSASRDKENSKGESFKLREVMEKSIEKCKRKYKLIRPGFIIDSTFDPSSEFIIPIAPEHGSMIFESLIDNSVKFNEKNQPKVNISITSNSEDRLTVSFTDNGTGIPAEYQRKVFDKFFQIDKYFTGMIDGIGLGLPLTKKILDLYGQKITLNSNLNCGTSVSITLPLKKN